MTATNMCSNFSGFRFGPALKVVDNELMLKGMSLAHFW